MQTLLWGSEGVQHPCLVNPMKVTPPRAAQVSLKSTKDIKSESQQQQASLRAPEHPAH